MVLLNYGVIEPMLVPDECYYHSHEPNAMMNLFYSYSSASGGHPEPNLFNFVFTLIVGFFFARLFLKLIAMRLN